MMIMATTDDNHFTNSDPKLVQQHHQKTNKEDGQFLTLNLKHDHHQFDDPKIETINETRGKKDGLLCLLSPDSLRDPSLFTQLIMSNNLSSSILDQGSSSSKNCINENNNQNKNKLHYNKTSPSSSFPLKTPHSNFSFLDKQPQNIPTSINSSSQKQINLNLALSSKVVNSIGQQIDFAQVLHPKLRTIVIFIRHFRCPFCQQYIRRLSQLAATHTNMMILKSRLKIVIIGQGHHQMIGPYRALYNCPFPIYSDQNPLHPLFSALGMSPKSLSRGPPDWLKGSYLDQISLLEILIQTIKNATKMPLKYGGDLRLNGGDFIFEPVPQHRIRRKPIQLVDQDHIDKSLASPKSSSAFPKILPSPPLNKVSKPSRAFLQSQILINFADHVNNKNLDSKVSSTASSATAQTNFSSTSNNTTINSQNSVYCTSPTSPSYSIWSSESTSLIGKTIQQQQIKLKFQCRFIHRMRFMRDHAPWDELIMTAAGSKLK